MALEVTDQFVFCVESFDASWMDTLELPSGSVATAMDSKVVLSPERSTASRLMALERTLFDRHTIMLVGGCLIY